MRVFFGAALSVIVMLIACAAESGATTRYRLVDLANISPNEINEHGQIAGTTEVANSRPHAALLQPGSDTLESINFGTGGHNEVYLNNYGQILDRGILWGTGGFRHPFWTPNAPNGALGTIGTATYPPHTDYNLEIPEGVDIGDDGTMLFNAWDFAGGGWQSYVWKPTSPNGSSGAMTLFGGGGGTSVFAKSINSRGDIAGRDANGGFVFIPTTPNGLDGVRHKLSATPMGLASSAEEINDVGQIVGAITVGNRLHAMLWNPQIPNGSSGVMHDLGLLPGRLQSYAVDVNNSGVGIGVANDNTTFSGNTSANGLAFIWTEDAGMRNLVDLVDSTGDGWRLYLVGGINDRGQIVGTGLYDPDGDGGVPAVKRGFLLNPVPEPTAMGLCLAAFIGCASRRMWRRF